MKKNDSKIAEKQGVKSVSLILTGDKEKDVALITLCGNCVRNEFELLLKKKSQEVREKHLKRLRENTRKSDLNNWQKHMEILNSWKELQEIMPHRMVERIQEKYPILHTTEIWICCLRYFNFEFFEIAEMLSCSKQTVHTKSSRIRRKLRISGKGCITRFFEENPWIV